MIICVFGLEAQSAIFQNEPPVLNGALHACEQMISCERLGYEVEGAMFQGRHSHRDIAVPGHENDRYFGIAGDNRFEDGMAVHFWHTDIGDDDPGVAWVDPS
ncbi:hypothetical protein MBENS4_4526 [Novosphingobium sp. MBES04]|nr:hypothetical protein MBENS4_4526 [Novosphingobium sp. MBES04]